MNNRLKNLIYLEMDVLGSPIYIMRVIVVYVITVP